MKTHAADEYATRAHRLSHRSHGDGGSTTEPPRSKHQTQRNGRNGSCYHIHVVKTATSGRAKLQRDSLPHAAGRRDAVAVVAGAGGWDPTVELCERTRRAMCVYAELASQLMETAWQRCKSPADVREMRIAAAPWEAWVRRAVVRHEDSRLELLQLQHAYCVPGVRELDVGALESTQRLPTVSTCVEVLQRCTQLMTLGLTRRRIDEATMSQLCVGFTGLSRLQTLDISRNPLRARGVRWLAEALTHTPALTCLDVSCTQLDEEAMRAFQPALCRLSQLQKLDMHFNPLGARGAAFLARGLCHTPALAVLGLEASYLDAAAMAALEPAFEHLSQLQKLNMYGNPLRASGAAALARALCYTPSLTRLRLDSTSLDAAAMAALEPALSRLHQLKWLNVCDNDIGPDGAACLARALRHMPSLKYLCAVNTSVDEAGKAAVQAAVPKGCWVWLTK